MKINCLVQVDLPDCNNGPWDVKKRVVARMDFHGASYGRYAPVGSSCTCLFKNGKLWMSDTPDEQRDHRYAVHKAQGVCYIGGLGIGMVLKNILLKPEVTKVIVVEIDQELVDLIAPFYPDPRVEIVCMDAYEYKPPKGVRFGMVWHDIWPNLCTDNLPEMAKLHRKFAGKADWQDSWGRDFLRRQKRIENREEKERLMWRKILHPEFDLEKDIAEVEARLGVEV